MNYLAHAYLSFGDPGILTGNLISDFVKGKAQFEYPHEVRKGITLHRKIDAFTDEHAATRDAKQVFRPYYRLYSGAFVDVVYDYYLANDGNIFNAESLAAFAEQTYRQLEPFIPGTPASFQRLFPYMRNQNWLYNYRFADGIKHSLGGLVRRAAYLTESDTAFALFKANDAHLQSCYNRFFPELKSFVVAELAQL